MKRDVYSILDRFTSTEMTTLKSLKAPGPLVIFATAATFALCGEKALDWATAQKSISSLYNKMCALDIENIPFDHVKFMRREYTKK
jgi:hypothetical protein